MKIKAKRRRRSRIEAEPVCRVVCFNKQLVASLKRRLPSEDSLDRMSELFGILSDRSRLKIFHALARGEELCVCDLAHILDLSISATSHQLRKLRDLKLVRYRNDGRMVYYRLGEPRRIEALVRAFPKLGGK